MGDRSEQTEVIARGVWVEGGHVLVCRNVERGHCFLPGGHVEFNEPAPVALARELYEEAGLRVKVGAFLGVVEAAFDQMGKKNKPARRHHELNLLFAFAPAGRVRRAGAPPLPVVKSREGHIEFAWLPIHIKAGVQSRGESRVQSPESGVVAGGLRKHVPRGTRLHEGRQPPSLDSGLGTRDSGLDFPRPALTVADLLPHGIGAILLELCTNPPPHPPAAPWRSLWK